MPAQRRDLGPFILAALVCLVLGGGWWVWRYYSVNFAHPDWTSQTIAESQARGQRIAGAILASQREQGRLPQSLEQLVPRYLVAIEPPTAGTKQWRYMPDSSGGFALEFNANAKRYPKSWYESSSGQWRMDQ